MEIKIKTKHGYYDCLDTLIVTIGNYWGLDYEYMLHDSWNFKFSPAPSSNESLLGTQISENSKTNFSALRDYHEFSIEFYPITDLSDFLQVVRGELANDRPVAVSVDTFWCPWIKYQYQKTHRAHYCLITEIDDNNNMQVIESQIATTPKLLPYSHFLEGYRDRYVLFSKTKPRISNVFDWRKSILEKIESFSMNGQDNSIFEQMKLFSKLLPEQLNIDNEIIGFELMPLKSPIYENIFKIGKRRLQYSEYLKYISKKYQILELDSFSKHFKSIGAQWQSIFGILAKAYYTSAKSKIFQKVSDKIASLSEIEEQLSSELYNFCLNNSSNKSNIDLQYNQKHISNRIESFKHIGLLEYFNNNGVSDSYEITGVSEFSNGGRYFDASDFPNQRFIQIENMNFMLPEISINSFDNIYCSGQELQLSIDSPKYIMFLGCSELGSHSEYVEITYSNGEKKELLIEFTNYCKFPPIFDERTAWESRVLERQNDQVNEFPYKGYVYAKNYSLDIQDKIVSIKLPECMNMHIFAITFGF